MNPTKVERQSNGKLVRVKPAKAITTPPLIDFQIFHKSAPGLALARDPETQAVSAQLSINPIPLVRNDYSFYSPFLRNLFYTDGDYYLLTFKPYDGPYEEDIEWYRSRMLNEVKKKIGKVNLGFFVREELSEKYHIHALIQSDQDLLKLHGKPWLKKRGFLDIRSVPNTDVDKKKVFDYITKECLSILWHQYEHFNHTKIPQYCYS